MRLSLAALAIFLALPAAVSAQALGDMSPFTISVSPQFPVSNSVATLSFDSTSVNLSNSTLTVFSNGTQVYQGAVHSVSVPLGGTGIAVAVTATIVSGGTTYTQKISIAPQDVAIVAEPLSSAPPLYPGKSSVPLLGNSRIVAVADLRDAKGKSYDPATLGYAWTVDDTQIANSSGIGKTSLVVASPLQYRNRTVSVTATSPDGKIVGGASLALIPHEPTVRIYENDLLLGIRYDHEISGAYNLSGAEASLFAAPFSFATGGGQPILQWFLNGAAAQSGDSITLHPTGSGQGTASLSLTASPSSGGFTTASQNLSITFGNKPGTGLNLFGL